MGPIQFERVPAHAIPLGFQVGEPQPRRTSIRRLRWPRHVWDHRRERHCRHRVESAVNVSRSDGTSKHIAQSLAATLDARGAAIRARRRGQCVVHVLPCSRRAVAKPGEPARKRDVGRCTRRLRAPRRRNAGNLAQRPSAPCGGRAQLHREVSALADDRFPLLCGGVWQSVHVSRIRAESPR
jgi:hypothetical protein